MKMGILKIGMLCLAFLLMTAQKSVYIWKDGKGVTHIGDTKPKGVKDVQESTHQESPLTPEASRPSESKTDDFIRSLEEEKAKRSAQHQESIKQEQSEKVQKERERLRAEEEQARELYDKAYSPFVRNYSIQKLRQIEEEKQRLRELEEKAR